MSTLDRIKTKILISIILIFVVSFTMASCIVNRAMAGEYSLADFYEEHSKSVVQVCSTIDCERGGGSGVYIKKDLILTNYHVINYDECNTVIEDNVESTSCTNVISKQVKIKTHSGIFIADVIGFHKNIDIAILKLTNYGHGKPVLIGDSSKLRIGDIALTIGSGRGLYNSFGIGYITGLNRETGLIPKNGVIQTSSPINRGDSGGALFDSRGRLVGIIYAKILTSDNIGFVIPINMIMKEITREK